MKTAMEVYIDMINVAIEGLKELDIKIHDNDDFEWFVDHVRYSQAQDKVIIKMK